VAKQKAQNTPSRCNTCRHDCQYPDEVVGSYPDTQKPVWYCGALDLPPELVRTELSGDPEAIGAWIRAHDFSVKGQPVGKITDPCPGYELGERH